jgi:starch synthase
MNVLMVASEAAPFSKTGGLGDVIGALPAALAGAGENVGVVTPAYRRNSYPSAPREVFRNLWIPLGPGFNVDIYASIERGVTVYFVHCPPLFDRDEIYGSPDDFLRFAVLSMAALGVVRHLFPAQIIHVHDWQAALVPVYLREHFLSDPTFTGIKTLYTIHNLGYQGVFGREILPMVGLNPGLYNPEQLEAWGNVNYMKGGIGWSHAVSTVSKGYAREIQTLEYGFGLDGYLRKHAPIHGIVNGVDYEEWNPEHDPHIERNYSAADLAGKRECKRALLAEFGLADSERPVIGIVSRFAKQKGFDLIAEVASQLLEADISLTILGSGEWEYESMFRHLAAVRPDKVGLRVGYDEALAHRIEAGADMFVMPSRYEPCGLSQIYSLRYGTVPIVRATGGLDDTVDEGTGFKFQEYSGGALLGGLGAALAVYRNRTEWTAMMRRGMGKDFSWSKSAREYLVLYRDLVSG